MPCCEHGAVADALYRPGTENQRPTVDQRAVVAIARERRGLGGRRWCARRTVLVRRVRMVAAPVRQTPGHAPICRAAVRSPIIGARSAAYNRSAKLGLAYNLQVFGSLAAARASRLAEDACSLAIWRPKVAK